MFAARNQQALPSSTPRHAETFNALLLSKSLRQRMWTDSSVETRQLAGIGPQIAQVGRVVSWLTGLVVLRHTFPCGVDSILACCC